MNESRTLELKESVTNTFLKTVSAYANFGSGEIRFGIRDDGTIKGIDDPDKIRLDIENRINDSIRPKPDYHFEYDSQNRILSLFVEEGTFKPYLYRGKAYRRSDTATVECDQTELRRLVMEGSNLTFDQLKSNDQKLTFQILNNKIREVLNVNRVDRDTLKILNLYTDKNGYNNAAALLSDKNHFAGIDMVRFGKSLDIMKERATVKNVSVLKQYEEAVKMYRRYYQEEIIRGVVRENRELIPEKAFREAVANALVHREWDVNADIHISMLENRIEVVSIGGLPEEINEQEYLNGGISILRNPVLANVMFRLHYIESFGTGIRRIRNAYWDSTSKPEFNIQQNSIRIVLPTVQQKGSLSEEEQKILDTISEKKMITSGEIAEMTGYSKDKTIRLLNRMIHGGNVTRIGKGRGTKYTIE